VKQVGQMEYLQTGQMHGGRGQQDCNWDGSTVGRFVKTGKSGEPYSGEWRRQWDHWRKENKTSCWGQVPSSISPWQPV